MTDPASLTTAIDNASKVANTPLFTTIIDRMFGYKLSKWAAEGEVIKKQIHDEYAKANENGTGPQYIQYLRHNTNLLDTAVKSSKYIDQNKSNEIKMDNDFFWNTIEHAQTISNDEMQELIAKVIAGEYNKPGSYSMSTLHTIKMLGKYELELFETVCSFLIENIYLPQAIFQLPSNAKPLLNTLKINFENLQMLQNLGLFLPNEMTMILKNESKENFGLRYFDMQILYKPTHNEYFDIRSPNYYSLSHTGEQIIQHMKPKFNEEYYNWLKENYKIQHYEVVKN